MTPRCTKLRRAIRSPAFTLVELLVVVGIVGVLIAILLPTVSKIRLAAQESGTRSTLSAIESATNAYAQDYRAFPGPFGVLYLSQALQQDSNAENIYLGDPAGSNAAINAGIAKTFANGGVQGQRLTGTENLVLGLMGGILNRRGPVPLTEFKKDTLGLGPIHFRTSVRRKPYLVQAPLSSGKFTDESSGSNPAKDTIIPEFLDSFGSPMPLLYIRARVGGGRERSQALSNANNDIICEAIPSTNGQYSLLDIAPYTQSSIGEGKRIDASAYRGRTHDPKFPHGLAQVDISRSIDPADSQYQYPYNAYAYFREPNTQRARNHDKYILISAGRDRVYGTADDLTNFGSVLP